MARIFNFKTKEEVLDYLHKVKQRKQEREAEAQAQYRAMHKETENLRKELYATIGA